MKFFSLISTIACDIGWPESYTDDLNVHDKNALTGRVLPFAWSVRKCGTWTILPERFNSVEWADAVVGQRDGARFFIVNGEACEVDGAAWVSWVKDQRALAVAQRRAVVKERVLVRAQFGQPHAVDCFHDMATGHKTVGGQPLAEYCAARGFQVEQQGVLCPS